MSIASKTYFQLALQAEKLMREEKDQLKQKELAQLCQEELHVR